MSDKPLIHLSGIPDSLLADLDTRDIALCIRDFPTGPSDRDPLLAFLGLPWRLVLSEASDPSILRALQSDNPSSAAMTRKRGFVQVIDQDPSRIQLPQRCLPFYVLPTDRTESPTAPFDHQLRRLTMLEELRRSAPRQLLFLSVSASPVPPWLADLFSAGFRAHLTFVADRADSDPTVLHWLQATPHAVAANLVTNPLTAFIADVLARYSEVYPEHRHVVRVRNQRGIPQRVDITDADEPERPILQSYTLVEERDLRPLLPTDLSEEDFTGFFQNPEASWRPYAAGLPWIRDRDVLKVLLRHLNKLDAVGSRDNCIAFVASESGAGGTTLARTLAWECASQGYPVLIAKPLPFIPDALPVTNFMKRVYNQIERATTPADTSLTHSPATFTAQDNSSLRYEAPWLIVFDAIHWQNREADLVRYTQELQKSGRPVCILLVTGTALGLPFYTNALFTKLAELNHAIDRQESLELGRHLNKFLRLYNKQRSDTQWLEFYEQHNVRYLEGMAAFWVTLSFWIQGQYDLSESIQEWMYREFRSNTTDPAIRIAILEVAAFSSERLPLPESLLPPSLGRWPISQLLEDARSSLGALGLVKISVDGERHWALIHDILGRFLINALFYDNVTRAELDLAQAKDPEHLRFLLLQRVSRKPALGERYYRALGEGFATSIFKIDPDHGHGSFVTLWREVLQSLDAMPPSLVNTSRVFRHHTAISRRRIAKLGEALFGVTASDRQELLGRAVDDINYAILFIDYSPGSERNLNLFTSLANAYFDLARAEELAGASVERLAELRRLAAEATRKAFEEDPTSPFVIEIYVKKLLQDAGHADGSQAVGHCVEALGILFSALASTEGSYRMPQLGTLADEALALLFGQDQDQDAAAAREPESAIDVLVNAWRVLAEDGASWSETGLTAVSSAAQARALDVLGHPAGRGNMQVLRLSYDLLCLRHPGDFTEQLSIVEQLRLTDYRLAPQLQLEYAILLFQGGRAAEGDKEFKRLRRLWHETEDFVHVPERLRWLHSVDSVSLQTVRAVVGSDYGNSAMARVREFGNALAPFRPEEHGFRGIVPGRTFACHVSFGHKGPFLRPPTAGPSKLAGE